MRRRASVYEFTIVAAYAVTLGWQAWHLGVTADEPSHLAASYAWWLGRDVLEPSDTPPFTRIICGWIPAWKGVPSPFTQADWRNKTAHSLGAEILGAMSPASAHQLMFCMRLPFLTFPILCMLLVVRWARQLFSRRTAAILGLCTALEPSLLAHGALMNSDVPAAAGALWFGYTAWRYWCEPRTRQFVYLVMAVAVACIIKFTLLVLLPVAILVVAVRGRPRALAFIPPCAVYAVTLISYQFQAAPLKSDFIGRLRIRGFPSYQVNVARALRHLPWPAQYIRGLELVAAAAMGPDNFPGYMLGKRVTGFTPLYYPLTLAVKYPIPLQILTVAGIACSTFRTKRAKTLAGEAFIWGLAFLFLTCGVLSHYHLGYRHILPAVPLLVLGGGFALERWAVIRRFAAPALLSWLAVASFWIYPHGISYFNEWVGGPENGWRFLADSNLDWGQDFPELAQYVRQTRIPVIKTYLFGLDPVEHYLPPGSWEPQPAPWSPTAVSGTRLAPGPGYYAVSVNLLLGFLFKPEYRDYFAAFRTQRPIGRAGYSIYIYLISAAPTTKP